MSNHVLSLSKAFDAERAKKVGQYALLGFFTAAFVSFPALAVYDFFTTQRYGNISVVQINLPPEHQSQYATGQKLGL